MKIVVVLGTRPEVIKLAPVILEARKQRQNVFVVLTGQHRHMALPLLEFFGIKPDLDLDVMAPNQTLTSLSQKILEKLDTHADQVRGDVLLVQGDTTSAFIAGYWSFCHGIPVAHLEAGLRTYDLQSPFPEEANRQLLSRIGTFHFAPTSSSKKALLKENIPPKNIHVVGNSAIDALLLTLEKLKNFKSSDEDAALRNWVGTRKLVLVTAHRRESFGKSFENMCKGIVKLVNGAENICAIYPVHPNPKVRAPVNALLGNHPRIKLIEPLSYVSFVSLMQQASLLLTDSGGVQEEGPSLRKPILVMRDTSERPEGIKLKFAKLVGTNADKIAREGLLALKKGCSGKGKNPYGDGKTSQRVVKILQKSLAKKNKK